MAYIYKIINDVNGKIYVGKTEFSIEKRFKEHCNDSQKKTGENRPLYTAMRKYGTEHFYIELLEETDNPEEREKYWIETLGSFKAGYNATAGGDGRKYLDYDLIAKTYDQVKSGKRVAELLGYDVGHVQKILNSLGYDLKSNSLLLKSKPIAKCDKKTGDILEIFSSIQEAGRFIGKSHRHLGECANGKRKSAYGFSWKFI